MPRHKISLLLSMAALAGVLALTPSRNATISPHTAMAPVKHSINAKRFDFGSPGQYAELWLPEGSGPHPVAVLIHGGCWLASLPGADMMAQAAEDLRQNGIAVWNLEYRRVGEHGGGYPGTYQDIAAELDALRDVAKNHPLDLSRVALVGYSAGGHLALWAAGRKNLPASSPLHVENPLPVAGVVSLGGIGDLRKYRESGAAACGVRTVDAMSGVNAHDADLDPYADTSPAALLPFGVPQIIVSGELDTVIPPPIGHAYANTALEAGDPAQILDLSGAGHFELIYPPSIAWPPIRENVRSLLGIPAKN